MSYAYTTTAVFQCLKYSACEVLLCWCATKLYVIEGFLYLRFFMYLGWRAVDTVVMLTIMGGRCLVLRVLVPADGGLWGQVDSRQVI